MTQPPLPTGALTGIRIIDMTGVVLGSYATQILGDYGADIEHTREVLAQVGIERPA